MNFKKVISLFLVVILAATSLVGCGNEKATNDEMELVISAAASLTDVLEEIKEVYKTNHPNTTLTYTFGSSGALQAQIEEGAPVDIFMSAAEKQMDALEEGGHTLKDTRKTLLVNKVVLITPNNTSSDIKSFEDLTKDSTDKIAIGDPGNVPVGQYSEEIFNSLNMWDQVEPKLVLGNDVRTVLTWVENGEVDCGIVYATDAYRSDKIQIITEAPDGSHKEVTYPVALIQTSKEVEAAKSFLDFLSTEEAKKLFEKYGFSMK